MIKIIVTRNEWYLNSILSKSVFCVIKKSATRISGLHKMHNTLYKTEIIFTQTKVSVQIHYFISFV